MRPAHQPASKPVKYEEPSADELLASCGKIAALVLAREDGTTPLSVVEEDGSVTLCKRDEPLPRPLQPYRGKTAIAHTLEVLKACGVCGIEISAAKSLHKRIADEAANAYPSASVAPYEPHDDHQSTLAHGNFEAFNLGFGTLEQARDLAARSNASAVLVIPCDLVNFKPRHMLKLAKALHDHPETEVVASWAVWLNRPPYLLRSSFLDELEGSRRCQKREGSAWRPMPDLKVHEVVFGEEMLMATPPASKPEDAFFDTCTISALEAVRKVRAEQAESERAAQDAEAYRRYKAKADQAAKRNAAYAGVSFTSGTSPSDELLMQTAREVLKKLDAVRETLAGASDGRADELETWDRWAHRNKLDFPIFNDRRHKSSLVYLDSAATTQRVGRALDAQHRFDAYENANIYRGAYELSAQSTTAFNEARRAVENHIGAERRSVIFTANTSAAAGLVAQAWGEHNIGPGDRILVPATEHHSNLVPWLMLAQRKGAHIDYIPALDDGSFDFTSYLKLLEKHPKLVCVAHISNVLGMKNPVENMAKAAHEAGARVYVDAAQSFPHISFNVSELGADFIGFSAHKAYGPMGLGCLWTSTGAFDEMDPLIGGGGTVSHVGLESYYLRDKAVQYELGTPPVSQAIGFAAALEYLDDLGMDAVERHSAALTKYLVAGLDALEEELGGVTVWGNHISDAGLTGLVSFSLAGIPAKSAASTLGKLGVCVRAGGHCALPLHASLGLTGSIRFSFGVHTTLEDIEAGLIALVICRRIYEAK